MKIWIKRGIFGLVIALFIGIIYHLYIFLFYGLKESANPYFLIPFLYLGTIFSYSGLLGCNPKQSPCTFLEFLGIIISILIYFSLGVISGYFLDLFKQKSLNKIKKRRKNK